MAYYAVAITKFGNFVEKFGPPFVSEEAAWKWLHYLNDASISPDAADTPPHDSIEVLEYFEYIKRWEDSINRQQELAAEEYFAQQAPLHEVAKVEDPDLIPF